MKGAVLFILHVVVYSLPLTSRTSPQRLISSFQLAAYEQTFRELYGNDIPEWLLSKCDELGFKCPTNTQKIALPIIFNKTDCILQSQTGSGKTLTFALPILSKIDPSRAAIQVVIIAPTRELGLQISTVLKQLASGSDEKILIMSIMEGSQNRRQQIWAVAGLS
jgi:superfamily II DNA/RNA helicase